MTNPRYAATERADGCRLASWFSEKGLELRPLLEPHDRSLKRPDFEVYQSGRLVGRCELKSFGLGPWDWDNARPLGNGLFEFQASDTDPQRECDQIHIRLSRSLVDAARQLETYDPHHASLWIVAIGNHDAVADLRDLAGVLRGEDIEVHGRYGIELYNEQLNPELKRISHYRRIIDAVIWMEKDAVRLKLNDADPEHFRRLSDLLS